jgi:MarR family transcriptional regulator, negative regulator of the multidrug operon emrRAB
MGPIFESCQAMKAAVARVADLLPGLPVDDVTLLKLLNIAGTRLDQAEEAWLKPYQLSNSEFRTLMMLFSSPGQQTHPSELCQWASQKPTNMTRIIDSLLKRGLVTRRPSDQDRRRIILEVTPQGDQLVRELLPLLRPKLQSLFKGFTPEEHLQLRRLAEKLLGNIDAMDTPSA